MKEIIAYLKSLAAKTIADCTFYLRSSYFGTDAVRPILLPSGDNKYGSFWVRDCAMMAESGLVNTECLRQYVEIISCHGQNGGTERVLANNLRVPPYAVADHINYDSGAVYYPGTYNSDDNQGVGTFGFYPPFCDNFYYVIMADCYIRQSGKKEILSEVYNGMTLYDRMAKAVECYQIDEKTGLCRSDDTFYTVDWGFTDSIIKSGLLLMSSLLRYRAAKIMASYSDGEKAAHWNAIASQISKSVIEVFYEKETGWMYSATGKCRQHDVWATAYAGYLGILDEDKMYEALRDGYLNQTAVHHGYVRQILTTENASETTAWECAVGNGFGYQNGGYWATATGWYARALYAKYPELAEKMLNDFIAHTEEFRDTGSPFEWTDVETKEYSGCHYGTSGALPYAAFNDFDK